jgi:hypothetical protein
LVQGGPISWTTSVVAVTVKIIMSPSDIVSVTWIPCKCCEAIMDNPTATPPCAKRERPIYLQTAGSALEIRPPQNEPAHLPRLRMAT